MTQDTAIQIFGHAKAQTHGMVCLWVAQSRDAKEVTKERATSLALLATELAEVDIVETQTWSCPIPQCGARPVRTVLRRLDGETSERRVLESLPTGRSACSNRSKGLRFSSAVLPAET